MNPLERDLRDVDTYIPPEATKTQFEGALNALRAERKVSIEFSLEYYEGLLARREAEKAELEQEMSNVQARIAARLAEIQRENDARQRNFPTAVHLSGPDEESLAPGSLPECPPYTNVSRIFQIGRF